MRRFSVIALEHYNMVIHTWYLTPNTLNITTTWGLDTLKKINVSLWQDALKYNSCERLHAENRCHTLE